MWLILLNVEHKKTGDHVRNGLHEYEPTVIAK